jgi:multiple sugar transport system ATP-binding protein
LDLAVASTHCAVLGPYTGKKVTFGIRPEDMRENVNQTPTPGSSITANVEVVEPMGSEIYLYLAVGNSSLTARIKSEHEPEVNKPYVINIAMDKAHYFDMNTEQTIV